MSNLERSNNGLIGMQVYLEKDGNHTFYRHLILLILGLLCILWRITSFKEIVSTIMKVIDFMCGTCLLKIITLYLLTLFHIC